MDPRLTPEVLERGNNHIRLFIKAVKSVVNIFMGSKFKVILVLVDESEPEINMALASEVEDKAELIRYLQCALQRVTNPDPDQTVDLSDPIGTKH
jgi:hypothetical protein